MPHRRIVLTVALVLTAVILRADSAGQRELAAGREALARHEAAAAAAHFQSAVAALDPQREKEALAEAWLQLGIAELTGLGRAEEALAAFTRSAEVSASPASAWLWAASAAEKLGRTQEAADLKARALAAPAPPQPAAGPQPAQPETVGATPAPPPGQPPAPAPRPDAFQHFFGAKDRKAAPPGVELSPPPEGPAVAPPAAAAPGASAAQPTPLPEGKAFTTLFGENRPDRPAGARQAQAEKAGKGEPAEAARKAAAVKKGDAFRFFFGEKKQQQPGKAKEKPPEKPDGGEG